MEITLNIPDTSKPRVVIIGSGFGGINAIRKLKHQGFQVVIFDKNNYHTFQPLLYQVATASLEADSIAGPVRKIIAGYDDFHFRNLKVTGISPADNTVSTELGNLRYDFLIIANGMKTNFFGNDQMKKYAFPLKFIPDALNLRSQLIQLFDQASMISDPVHRKSVMTIVIAGGGPTGVEMAGGLSELRRHILPKDYPLLDFSEMKIYLIEGVDRLLPTMSPQASAIAFRTLEKMGILIQLKTMVQDYNGKTISLKSGELIDTKTVLWTAGVSGDQIPGLPAEWVEKGRLLVNENCLVKGSKNIFAVGDIAEMKSEQYPKGHPGLAQPAIQMGAYVGKNLKALSAGKSVKPFSYFNKGSLATIGRGKAVADIGKLHFGGRLAWYIWLFVHISFLVSFRNKLLVLANWVWNFFTHDKGNRLIIRPFIQPDDPAMQKIFISNQQS